MAVLVDPSGDVDAARQEVDGRKDRVVSLSEGPVLDLFGEGDGVESLTESHGTWVSCGFERSAGKDEQGEQEGEGEDAFHGSSDEAGSFGFTTGDAGSVCLSAVAAVASGRSGNLAVLVLVVIRGHGSPPW